MITAFALASVVASAKVVAIEVEPGLDPISSGALVQSCSAVFSSDDSGACALVSGEPWPDSTHRAQIDWIERDGGLQVTIEIAAPTGSPREMRVLSFHESSVSEERWQAVGLVVAALVNARVVQERARAPEPAVEPPPEEPAPPVTLPDAPGPFTLEFGGALRQELTRGFTSGGGIMRLSFLGPSRFEPTWGVGFFAGSNPVHQLSVRPSLGLGFYLVRAPVRLTLRGELVGWITRFSAEDALGADSEWHVRGGGALGPFVYVPITRRLAFFAGAQAALVFPPVRIRVRGEERGQSSVFGGEGSIGLWAAF